MVDENRERIDRQQRSQGHLVNVRTFLSWLRTCIALIGLGFVLARFGFFLEQFGLIVRNSQSKHLVDAQTGHFQSTFLGICVVILGILLLIFALKNYLSTTKAIEEEDFVPKNFNIYAASISIVVLSFVIVIYLLGFIV